MESLCNDIGLIREGKILLGAVVGMDNVSLVSMGSDTGWSINGRLKQTSKGNISGNIGAT
jgi:hypothetical protein